MNTRLLAAAAVALFLTACGGGGGDGGGGGPGPVASADEAMQGIITETPDVSVADVQNTASTVSAVSQAVSSLPAFGSVTQSANRDGVSGVSTDRASTEFDGETFVLEVDRQSGTDIHLSTAEDHTIAFLYDRSPVPGHDSGADGHIIDYTPSETTIAYAAVSWLNSDPTDYLAGGYWLHASGDILGTFEIDEAGAFADGPEISMSNRPTMPVQGTASYSGYAEGLYGVEYGTDAPGYEGTLAIGIFYADMALTADFNARTIDGCVGCNGGVSLNGSPSDYRVRLGATPFESNGVYRSTSVTVEHPNLEFVSNSGAWGGMFSSVPDADGDPRLVAGTLGGQAATADGSKAGFVGAYYATGQ